MFSILYSIYVIFSVFSISQKICHSAQNCDLIFANVNLISSDFAEGLIINFAFFSVQMCN